jgi:hypothetical protein
MFQTKAFLDEIKALDKSLLKNAPAMESIDFETYQILCDKIWLDPMKSLIEENLEAIKKELPDVQKSIQKTYKSYISPLFSTYLSQLTYDDFPYEVSEKDYKALIQKIKKAKTPDQIHEVAEEFRKGHIIEGKQYTFRKLFRPYHPIFYFLQDIEKTVDLTFNVNAKRVVNGLCPYLLFPQNKNTKELQFALAFSAGVAMVELMNMRDVKKAGKWSIEYSTDAGEKANAELLFRANEWIRAFEFLQACELSPNQAKQSLTEIPLYLIGIPLSNKLIPAMHAALVRHFHGEKAAPEIQTKTNIKISGEDNLDVLIEAYAKSCKATFKEKLAAAPENVQEKSISMDKKIQDDPTMKLALRTIQEETGAKVAESQQVNDLFWETYAPLELRPTRVQKEKEKKPNKK